MEKLAKIQEDRHQYISRISRSTFRFAMKQHQEAQKKIVIGQIMEEESCKYVYAIIKVMENRIFNTLRQSFLAVKKMGHINEKKETQTKNKNKIRQQICCRIISNFCMKANRNLMKGGLGILRSLMIADKNLNRMCGNF